MLWPFVSDDDPRLFAPFKTAKHWEATHRHRKAPSQSVMVLMESASWVRYDCGREMWGLDSSDTFHKDWEPIPAKPKNKMLRMFTR